MSREVCRCGPALRHPDVPKDVGELKGNTQIDAYSRRGFVPVPEIFRHISPTEEATDNNILQFLERPYLVWNRSISIPRMRS